MLFSLFLITTISNEERMYLWIYIQGELASNGMNNLAFFGDFFFPSQEDKVD